MASGGTRDPRRRLRPPKESPTGWLPPRPVRSDATPTKLLTRFVAAGGEVNLRARETQRQWDGHLPRGLQVANLFEKRDEAKRARETAETLELALMIYIQIGFKARTCQQLRGCANLLSIDVPSHLVANAEGESGRGE